MAFLCVAVSILMLVLVFEGRELRKYTLCSQTTEDGLIILRESSEPVQETTKDTVDV